MRRRIVAFTVVALLTGAAGVSAQIYAPQSVERYFRLEWEATRGRKGPAVEGYVYNTGPRNAEHMRLQIERLDVSGKVVASSTVWVPGWIPMDGRPTSARPCPTRPATACRCSHSTGPAVVVAAAGCEPVGRPERLAPPQRESRPDTGP